MSVSFLYARFGKGVLLALAVLPVFAASAKEFSVPPMPVSAYADTEVSTNIIFNNHRSDYQGFFIRIK